MTEHVRKRMREWNNTWPKPAMVYNDRTRLRNILARGSNLVNGLQWPSKVVYNDRDTKVYNDLVVYNDRDTEVYNDQEKLKWSTMTK